MACVINEPCIGTKDTSCVEVCPVDCIHPTPDEPDYDRHAQLYIEAWHARVVLRGAVADAGRVVGRARRGERMTDHARVASGL